MRFAAVLLAVAVLGGGLAPAARADEAAKPADPIAALLERLKDTNPAEDRLAALKEAAGTDDPRLVPALGKQLKAEEPDARLAAAAALGARTMPDTKKKAATVLAERLKVVAVAAEKDLLLRDELLGLVQALHDLAQESTIAVLADDLDLHTDLEIVAARTMAIANVPSAKAIETLIDLMARRHRDGTGIRARASAALAYATGVKHANDADAWRAWWKDVKGSFDFQAAAEARAAARAAKTEKDKAATDRKDRKKKPATPPAMDGDAPPAPETPKEA